MSCNIVYKGQEYSEKEFDNKFIPKHGEIIEYQAIEYEVYDSGVTGSQLVKGEDAHLAMSEDGDQVYYQKQEMLDAIPVYNLSPTGKDSVVVGGVYPISNIPLTVLLDNGFTKTGGTFDTNKKSPFGFEPELEFQLEGTEVSKASKETLAKVSEFFKRNNIQVEELQSIKGPDGKAIGINGVADILNKLIQVADGKADVALTEEAMHFAVKLIKQQDPALFKQMMSAVDKYVIYRATFDAYKEVYTKDGKPDIAKIKEEAVGKILAEYVLNREGDVQEKPELISKVQGFWEYIKNALRKLVGKAKMNPFEEASATALDRTGEFTEADVFYQTNDQGKLYTSIASHNGVDIKRIEGKNEEGVDSNWYEIDGKKVVNRVTDLAKAFYERLFNSKDIKQSEYETAVNEFKRSTGVKGHLHMEHIFHDLIDDQGFLRATPLTDDPYFLGLSREERAIYTKLRENLTARITGVLKEHPNTRFMSEVIIHYPGRFKSGDEVGTIDLLYITPEGKVGIWDWKFIDLNTKRYDDVPWYKVKAWRIQIAEYKKILNVKYGVPLTSFLDTRAIPIVTKYKFTGKDENVTGKVDSIQIGDANIKIEDKDYLLPVGLEEEATGNKDLDEFITKLNSYYDKTSDLKVTGEASKRTKAELLNGIYRAIRHLHLKQDVTPLLAHIKDATDRANVFLSYVEDVIAQGAEQTNKEKSDITDYMAEIQESLLMFSEMDVVLDSMFSKDMTAEEAELKKELGAVSSQARLKLREVDAINKQYINLLVAKPHGIDSVFTVESVVKGLQRWFNTASQIPISTLSAIFKIRNEVKHKTDFTVSEENVKLETLRSNYLEWAKSKGLSETSKAFFRLIKKSDKNELIDEFNPEFYKTLKEKTKSEDSKWIAANVDLTAYKKHIAEEYTKELDRIESTYMGTSEEAETDRSRLRIKAAKEFTLEHPDSFALQNYNELKKFPNKEKWTTKEYQELYTKGNEAAQKFFEYIKERNEYYQSIGYIQAKYARTFLPFVEKSFTEKIVFGGKIELGKSFLRDISIDEGTLGFGNIDPITKEPVNGLPKYLTHDTGRDMSTDLFVTMGKYNEFAIRYKFLSEIEGQVRALARVEKNKNAIDATITGTIKTDKATGEPVIVKNVDNSKFVDMMIENLIYDRRYVNSEAFDQTFGKVGEWGKTINNKLGYKIFPEVEDTRLLSMNKSIDTMNRMFQQKILGLHVLSSMSNLLGGNFNSIINAGKFFTRSQFLAAESRILVSKLSGENGRKILAAIDYFMPYTEAGSRDSIKDLSLSKFSQEKVQDWIMGLMRSSDKLVQSTIFLAQLDNLVIIDGTIHNAREYVRKGAEFSNKYNLSEAERKTLEDGFEQKVKDLIKSNGLLNQAELTDGGKFSIPGVERNSASVYKVRQTNQNLAADALGNLTEGDNRLINTNIFGKSFMVFKSWIPRLADVRLGQIKYNSASEAYEWGRTRTFFRALTTQFAVTGKILMKSLVMVDGTGSEEAVALFKKMYETKKEEYERMTGKTLNMTEDEFIDMIRQNINSQMRDFMFYAVLIAMWIGAKNYVPDDDKKSKAYHNFVVKALDKFSDEVGFFYNPMSFQRILNGSVFPSLGIVSDITKLVSNFMEEMYGLVIDDDKVVDSAHPTKYLLKVFPGTNQLSSYLPMLYPDMAKDLGIQSTTQSRMK